jgi:hypothetical protein
MRSQWLLLLALQGAPAIVAAQVGTWTIDRQFTYDFDLRQGNPESDRIGLDFNLAFLYSRVRANPQGHHLGFAASATGFQDFEGDVRELDQMIGTVSLQGRYYATDVTPLRADLQRHYLELLGRPLESLKPAERDELTALVRRVTQNRRFFIYDAHYRFETTQAVDTSQHAIGASVSGELPHLHRVLDAIPAALAERDERFRPQPVRAYLAFDYVVGEKALTPATEAEDNRYPRLSLETAWSTLLHEDIVLRATWVAQYIFGAPAPIEDAEREFNSFVQAWIVYPVSGDVGLLVKYVDGRMPPTYESTSSTKLGFSISFQ